MNVLERLKNLWKLSEFHPNPRVSDGQGHIATLIKTPEAQEQATFIARVKKTPLDQVTEVANQSA